MLSTQNDHVDIHVLSIEIQAADRYDEAMAISTYSRGTYRA